ncbi:MAG: hypothetical protein RI953_2235 [Pseudomonadota bacterium]|jgi:hypothetical protein
MSREQKQNQDQTWLSREDLQDIAKIGGDLLKRTVSSGIDVLKDVTDTLPKDAQQIISRSREEVLKGISREFAQNLVSLAVDKLFAAVRTHRLDISIRVRKDSEKETAVTENRQETKQNQGQENDSNRHSPKRNHPGRNHHP